MQLLRPIITTPSVQRRTDGKCGAAIELSAYPVWVVGMAKRGKGSIRVEERQSRKDSAVNGSAWGRLREPIFRALWIASVASNVGSWMQDVGESWLMISLTKSPVLVALVETAGSLPIFLLALPAGALADVVDRRRLLLATQSWMGAALGNVGLCGLLNWRFGSRTRS